MDQKLSRALSQKNNKKTYARSALISQEKRKRIAYTHMYLREPTKEGFFFNKKVFALSNNTYKKYIIVFNTFPRVTHDVFLAKISNKSCTLNDVKRRTWYPSYLYVCVRIYHPNEKFLIASHILMHCFYEIILHFVHLFFFAK